MNLEDKKMCALDYSGSWFSASIANSSS